MKEESKNRFFDYFFACVSRLSHETLCPNPTANEVRRALIAARFVVRGVLETYNAAQSKRRAISHRLSTIKQQGVLFPMLNLQLEEINAVCERQKTMLADLGALCRNYLDLWQEKGATFEDFCDLCGLAPRLRKEAQERKCFSEMVFIHDFDYRPRYHDGWIDTEDDGSFTHALKEYFINFMLTTDEGRCAAHQAMEECFPDLMDKVLTLATDDDGNQVLFDACGEVVEIF